jgi:VanZ family protein
MLHAERTWRVLLGIALIAVAWVSLLPQSSVASASVIPDYLAHAAGYAVLGALAMLSSRGALPFTWSVLLIAFGLLLEVLQPVVADRIFSTADVLANALGVAIGVSFGWWFTRYRHHRQ